MPRKKILLSVFVSVVGFIALFAVFGENGLIDVYSFRKERAKLMRQQAVVEEENKRLSSEINLLKNDKRYIATVARRELGMVGKNEIVYRIEN